MLCSQGKEDRNEIREKGSRVRRAHTQPTGSALLALMSLIYPRLITWEGTFTNNKSLHRLESCLIMSVCGHMRGIPVSVCLSLQCLSMLMEDQKLLIHSGIYRNTKASMHRRRHTEPHQVRIWIFHKVSLRRKHRRLKCNDNRESNKFRSCARRAVPAHVKAWGY